MPIARRPFYLFASLSSLVGYIWLAFIGQLEPGEIGSGYDVCLIHHFLGFPCPSCGSTRSVLSLLKGDLTGGLYWNPLGLLIFTYLLVAPFWIGFDLFTRKDTLHQLFLSSERLFRRKPVAWLAIFLLVLNWIWNFYKGI